MVDALAQALQAHDAVLAGRHVHSLIGAAGAVGANAVLAAAGEISAWVAQDQFLEAESALPQLQRQLDAFAQAAHQVF